MDNAIIIFIISIGLYLFYIGVHYAFFTKCPKNRVIYKYIPRTWENQYDGDNADRVFYGMFNDEVIAS
jgi:hypothetical protein